MLGGIDDKPAEIEANGGKTPIAFNYADYGVAQPGYAIVAHRDTVKDNPDLTKRFVHATLESVKAAQADPDAAIAAIINWNASMEEDKTKVQARKVLDVTLSILLSPNNKEKRIGLNVPEDWAERARSAGEVQRSEDRYEGQRLLHQRLRPGLALITDRGRRRAIAARRRPRSIPEVRHERRRFHHGRQQDLSLQGGGGQRARSHRSRHRAGLLRLAGGPLGLRQEHAAAHGGGAAGTQRGRDPGRRTSGRGARDRYRHRLPGQCPGRLAQRPRQCAAADRDARTGPRPLQGARAGAPRLRRPQGFHRPPAP